MKRGSLILTAAMFIVATGLSARTTSDTTKLKAQICGIEVMAGVILSKTYPGTHHQFRTLMPGSELINSDYLNDFKDYHSVFFSFLPALTATTDIRFSREGRKHPSGNPVLRVGLGYSAGTRLTWRTDLSERYTFDTIFNTQSQVIGYRDSSQWHVYTMTYSSDRLHLDISLIMTTTPDTRVSLSGGIGISAGISTFAGTKIESFKRRYEETLLYNGHHYSDGFSSDRSSEIDQSAGNMGGTVYIPMSVNFRFGRNREASSGKYLFYEIRPGIVINKVYGMDHFISTSVHQGIGLRWCLR